MAHKFSLTYKERAQRGDLQSRPVLPGLAAAEHLLQYGGDAAGYVDVNMLEVGVAHGGVMLCHGKGVCNTQTYRDMPWEGCVGCTEVS